MTLPSLFYTVKHLARRFRSPVFIRAPRDPSVEREDVQAALRCAIEFESSIEAPTQRLSFYFECALLRVCGEACYMTVGPSTCVLKRLTAPC